MCTCCVTVPNLAPPKLHDPVSPRRGKLPGVYRCQEKAEQRKVQMPAGCLSNEEAGQDNSQIYYVEASPRQNPRGPCQNDIIACHNKPGGNMPPICEPKARERTMRMPPGCRSNQERGGENECICESYPSGINIGKV